MTDYEATYENTTYYSSWILVIDKVLKRRAHESIIIPEHSILHPLQDPIIKFEKTIGEPRGQLGDYEYTLPDKRRIHVREYSTYYEVHWDYASPKLDPIRHLVHDAPHWLLLGIIAVLVLARLSKK